MLIVITWMGWVGCGGYPHLSTSPLPSTGSLVHFHSTSPVSSVPHALLIIDPQHWACTAHNQSITAINLQLSHSLLSLSPPPPHPSLFISVNSQPPPLSHSVQFYSNQSKFSCKTVDLVSNATHWIYPRWGMLSAHYYYVNIYWYFLTLI